MKCRRRCLCAWCWPRNLAEARGAGSKVSGTNRPEGPPNDRSASRTRLLSTGPGLNSICLRDSWLAARRKADHVRSVMVLNRVRSTHLLLSARGARRQDRYCTVSSEYTCHGHGRQDPLCRVASVTVTIAPPCLLCGKHLHATSYGFRRLSIHARRGSGHPIPPMKKPNPITMRWSGRPEIATDRSHAVKRRARQ